MQWLYWLAALVGHGAFWVEVVNRVHGLGWPRKLIDAATLACAAACAGAPLAALATLLVRPSGATPPVWLAAYAAFSLAALATIVVTRAALTWDPRRCRGTERSSVVPIDLRSELGRDATGGPLMHRLAMLPGNTVLKPQLEHLTVPLERLPTALEGLRVAHLTDLHMSGRLSRAYFERLVEAVNAWRPDLVFITGDIVERMPQLDWVEPTLGRLATTCGSFFVLGNHDDKIDSGAMRRCLAGVGLVDVGGLTTEVAIRGVRVTVCGDERPWFQAEPPLKGAEPLVFCLAHTPDRFGWATARGVDLVLAGHNHGGQVCVPGAGALLCPSRHGVRYAAGTFRRGRTVMHVGRGSGSLFPLRYGCPPEVALITLTRG